MSRLEVERVEMPGTIVVTGVGEVLGGRGVLCIFVSVHDMSTMCKHAKAHATPVSYSRCVTCVDFRPLLSSVLLLTHSA